MEGENYKIVNWKIENLSCWNQALHGKCIETPGILFNGPDLFMELYPRGTSGQEEHMVVHLSNIERTEEFSGDLSFIGADGSTLCTQRVQSVEDESDIGLPPGPKFTDVIVKTRENKSNHKDQLTLRLQIKKVYRRDEYHVCTVIQVFDVTMEVDRSLLPRDDLLSDIRYVQDDRDTGFYLKTGNIREDEKIDLYLDPISDDTFLVKTNFRLIGSVGSPIRIEHNEHLFYEGEPSWTFSDSLSKEELSENVRLILNFKIISGKVSRTLRHVYMHFDDVKIIYNRYIKVCTETSQSEQNTDNSAVAQNDQENPVGVLSKELMCLYQDQDFSDLQLKCESVSFPVHKAILSARSTVFKTMLSSDMTEAATGCVDIADLEAPTLARFLAFLYTGAVEDLQRESALKLYYAADKYDVPSLKRECVSFLSANVCVSDVCDVLLLGDKHQDDELIAAAHNFILRNYNEVLKSKEWKSFMCSEPLLAVKTVTDFAEKGFVGNLNPLKNILLLGRNSSSSW